MDVEQNADNSSGWKSRLKAFPCFFFMQVPRINIGKMKVLKDKLIDQVKENVIQEEVIQMLNLIVWFEHKLDGAKPALAWSITALDLAADNMNITALSNKAYLLCQLGEEVEALDATDRLEELKGHDEYQYLRKRATADQAFAYRQFGGPKNLPLSIDLYEEAIKDLPLLPAYPEVNLWKYHLAIVYRRATHGNIFPHMPVGCSQKNCVERAVSLLFDVICESTNSTLKGRAFAELSCMCPDTENSFFNATQSAFWEKALYYGEKSKDVSLLLSLGKAMPVKDPDKTIYVLEKSLAIRVTSTAYHHLGLCYEEKAKQEMKFPDSQAQENLGKGNVKRLSLFALQFEPESPVDKEEELVAKALECYQNAINENDENIPAKYDYGLLLKACGDIELALKQFNRITNFQSVEISYTSTLIMAYEQAAKCFLKLHEKGTSKCHGKYKEEAEKKLMQAVRMSADMAARTSDMKVLAEDIWTFFRHFHDETNFSHEEPIAKNKFLLQFTRLVRDFGRETLQVVENLLKQSDEELDDPSVIEAGLESHLAMKRYDEAMVFLKLCQTRPSALQGDLWEKEPLKLLNIRVQLHAARDKLVSSFLEAKDIFRSLFTSRHKNNRDHVLVIYDDTHDSEDGRSHSFHVMSTLHSAFLTYFDLDVNSNLEGCPNPGVIVELMLEEVKRHSVVILLLGKEPMDSNFECLLKTIPPILPKLSEEGQTPPMVFVATTDETVEKPDILAAHRHLCIKEIIGELDRTSKEAMENPTDQSIGLSEQKAHALMTLFCFITDTTWPISDGKSNQEAKPSM